MPVPLIPCRHADSGEERKIPQTALYLFADWEPIKQAEAGDSQSAAAGSGESSSPSPADGEQGATPKQPAATGRAKAATSAKKTEED